MLAKIVNDIYVNKSEVLFGMPKTHFNNMLAVMLAKVMLATVVDDIYNNKSEVLF